MSFLTSIPNRFFLSRAGLLASAPCEMIRLGSLLSLAYLLFPGAASPAAPSWNFVLKGNSGIVGLEAIVVSPTLVVMFDRATNDPLHTPDGKVAWAALWNLETNKATPLKLLTDRCVSAAEVDRCQGAE
jgi:hypothetical protein